MLTGSSRHYFATTLLVLLASPVVGQSPEDLRDAIRVALQAKSVEDLLDASEHPVFRDPFVYEGLWYIAAHTSMTDGFQRDIDILRRVLKAFVFGTLLELAHERASWPIEEALFDLGPWSLRALNDATGLAPPGSPRESLFSRKPELSETWRDGYYEYMHFDHRTPNERTVRIVVERSDVPWADITVDYTRTRVESLPDANSMDHMPLEGLSYSFPIASMNYFVIAAKVYGCLALIGLESPYAKYAHLIAANALYAASLKEGNGHSAIGLSPHGHFPHWHSY